MPLNLGYGLNYLSEPVEGEADDTAPEIIDDDVGPKPDTSFVVDVTYQLKSYDVVGILLRDTVLSVAGNIGLQFGTNSTTFFSSGYDNIYMYHSGSDQVNSGETYHAMHEFKGAGVAHRALTMAWGLKEGFYTHYIGMGGESASGAPVRGGVLQHTDKITHVKIFAAQGQNVNSGTIQVFGYMFGATEIDLFDVGASPDSEWIFSCKNYQKLAILTGDLQDLSEMTNLQMRYGTGTVASPTWKTGTTYREILHHAHSGPAYVDRNYGFVFAPTGMTSNGPLIGFNDIGGLASGEHPFALNFAGTESVDEITERRSHIYYGDTDEIEVIRLFSTSARDFDNGWMQVVGYKSSHYQNLEAYDFGASGAQSERIVEVDGSAGVQFTYVNMEHDHTSSANIEMHFGTDESTFKTSSNYEGCWIRWNAQSYHTSTALNSQTVTNATPNMVIGSIMGLASGLHTCSLLQSHGVNAGTNYGLSRLHLYGGDTDEITHLRIRATAGQLADGTLVVTKLTKGK